MADILVIEDGFQERERLNRLFASSGYTVRTAESAEEAQQLLGVERFRLALLDIGLSGKSGSYLFKQMKRSGEVPYVVVFTGNPSIHLKQRFLDEGAAAYIVKASAAAENESLLETVRSLLGSGGVETAKGISLDEFLRLHLTTESRALFLDNENRPPPCANCGSSQYVVAFTHKTQLPPLIEGKVVCADCSSEMDPKIE